MRQSWPPLPLLERGQRREWMGRFAALLRSLELGIRFAGIGVDARGSETRSRSRQVHDAVDQGLGSVFGRDFHVTLSVSRLVLGTGLRPDVR